MTSGDYAQHLLRGLSGGSVPAGIDLSMFTSGNPAYHAQRQREIEETAYRPGGRAGALPEYNILRPGSRQLLRALSLRGRDDAQAVAKVRALEARAGTPLVSMDVYPHVNYGDPARLEKVVETAALSNILRRRASAPEPDPYERDSGYRTKAWSIHLASTAAPVLSMLVDELMPYLSDPDDLPVPYMLSVETDMQAAARVPLFTWLLSHRRLAELAAAIELGPGDLDFPGFYTEPRAAYRTPAQQRLSKEERNYLKRMRIPDTSYFPGRTNFWGSVLDPMFPYQEFIRMAGLLAKAHRDKPDAFTRFHKAMLDATDLEETPEPSSYGYKTRDSAEEPAYPGFGHFPNLLTAALARDPQNPEQIERARRFHERGDNFRLMMGVQLSHLAEQLFPKTERDLMDAAYHGKLLS